MSDSTSILTKYFPDLTADQLSKYDKLSTIFPEWNAKINLISRKDIEHLTEHHILHSLAIAYFHNFKAGTKILDIGTGGGFPGIPLAIYFPDVQFVLVDSIAKKIKVVNDLIEQLNLTNCSAVCARAESLSEEFDFVVSRATAPLADLHLWSRRLISKKQINAIPNGIICLKGGDLNEELKPFKHRTEVVLLSDYFKSDYYLTKKLVFLTV